MGVGRGVLLYVVEKSTLSPVGRASIRKGSRAGVWTFGYWVHPDYWGSGFAVEAARALIEFGFSHLGAAEITVGHAIWNHQSRRVVEKLSMRFVRENPCGFVKERATRCGIRICRHQRRAL